MLCHPTFNLRIAACGLLVGLCLVTARASAQRVELYSGQPFGVGVVTLSIAADGPVAPLEDDRFTVASSDGRVLYPVVKEQQFRRIIRKLLDIQSPLNVTIYFLFRGTEPIDLSAYAPGESKMAVVPRNDPAQHARLFAEWWSAYSGRWQKLRQNPQFPPVVDNFLAVNLARRLNLALPDPAGGVISLLAPKKTIWDDLFITERRQLAIDQQLLASPADTAAPLGPLPPQMPWPDLLPLEAPGQGKLPAPSTSEPLAQHVPAECFYVRFGNFTNYLWFRDLKKKWNNDLGNMLLRRGIDRASALRTEQQLALRENALAKILGPQVIADVAIIGLDPYANLGVAAGVLFQAKASLLLANDLNTQRREALTKFKDATEAIIKIGGRDVSYISTPGGEVRSYYVADGDFHLVTTSKRLVERFLEAGAGTGSLAKSTGFQLARRQFASDRDDSIFVYVGPEFIRGLTEPARWIETQRRARVAREAKLIELARLEAAAERIPADGVAQLVDAGFLPATFKGQNSLPPLPPAAPVQQLGCPGFFVPAVDSPATSATAAEAAEYQSFADRFHQEVGQTPPIAIAVRRTPLADASGETAAVDVWAGPLEGVKLGKLPDTIGPPSSERLAPVSGDVVQGELVLDRLIPLTKLLDGQTEPHHLFVGVHEPGAQVYGGAWPKPGMLRLLSGGADQFGPQPTQVGENVWQQKSGDFFLVGQSPAVMQAIAPQLNRVPATRPAQLWLEVDELKGTQVGALVNKLGYGRARETTLAACRIMNALTVQLRVPEDKCREIAEGLLDGKFVCPLGGEYSPVEVAPGVSLWTSTGLTTPNQFFLAEPPQDFQLTALSWFKGLRGDATYQKESQGSLTAHVEIDLAKEAIP